MGLFDSVLFFIFARASFKLSGFPMSVLSFISPFCYLNPENCLLMFNSSRQKGILTLTDSTVDGLLTNRFNPLVVRMDETVWKYSLG